MNMTKLKQELLKPRKWFDLSESNDLAEFYIYDVIGSDFWGDGFRAIDFINQVKNAKSANIHIHINSPGGDAYDGVAIYNALNDTKKNVRTIIDGIAASSASIIFSAGKERIMPTGAMEMIHRAWTFAMGNCKDMIKASEALERLDGNLAAIYHATSNHGNKNILDMMDAETYMDGEEAVKKGFATEVSEGMKIAALKWDRNLLPGIPDSFNKMQSALNKRDAESVLRDAGYSIAQAKKLAAGPRDGEIDNAEICRLIAKNIEILK